MRRRTSTAQWRWITASSLLALVLALPAGASAGTTTPCASATQQDKSGTCTASFGEASRSHVGWVYLNLNYCPTQMVCTMQARESTSAWSWSKSGWQPQALRQGWVYHYPYSGDWRWVWTSSTGWLAIHGTQGRFELRPF